MPGYCYQGNGFFEDSYIKNSTAGNTLIYNSSIITSKIDMLTTSGQLGIITNHALPINPYDVVNKEYVDYQINNITTIGNVSGNFTSGQVIVATTGGNITGYSSFIFNSTTNTLLIPIISTTSLIVTNITNSLLCTNNITTGSLNVNSINMNPLISDIFTEQSFYANNNQITPASVTGFSFSNTITRYIQAIVSVYITTTNINNNLAAGYEIKAIQNNNKWCLQSTFIGDKDIGVQFCITNTGQIVYTSTNIINWVSTLIKFRANTTSI
jgi:hypothetical protein